MVLILILDNIPGKKNNLELQCNNNDRLEDKYGEISFESSPLGDKTSDLNYSKIGQEALA